MKRILLVEDDRDMAEGLGELLAGTYQVTLAYNGAEALRILEAGGIDAVVLDLMIPIVSGEALMAELHARGILMPVIFASAAADLPARAERCRATDFIAKPFDISLLERKLARILGGDSGGGASNPGGTADPGDLPDPPEVQGKGPTSPVHHRVADPFPDTRHSAASLLMMG